MRSPSSARCFIAALAASLWSLWLPTVRGASGQHIDLQLTEVQSTALLVAYWRHMEGLRDSTHNPPSPALIQDPIAKVLMDELGHNSYLQAWKHSPILPMGINILALRTRAVDDWLEEGKGRPRQVVNLGAGMCGRPYRLNVWDETKTLFEVERNVTVLHIKHQVIEEAGYTSKVPLAKVEADLTDIAMLRENLLAAGFDPSLSTDWIAEGLFEYLPIDMHISLLQAMHEMSSEDSRILVWNGDPWFSEYSALIGFSVPHVALKPAAESAADVETAGWRNGQILDDLIFWERYQRVISLPFYFIAADYQAAPGVDELEL
jgi:methyltransferase (TIGR00027 family)